MADGRALTLRFTSDVDQAKAGLASLATSVVGTMNSIASTLANTTAGARAQETALARLTSLWREYGSAAAAAEIAPAALAVGGVLTAVAGYEALASAVRAAREQLSEMADVARDAEKAGVGAEFYQTFLRGARDAAASEKDFEDILTSLSRTVRDKFDESKGAVNEFYERVRELGFESGLFSQGSLSGLELFRNADTAEQRVRAILVVIQEIRQNAGDLAAIDFAKLAGGDKFAEGIRTGRIELQRLIDLIDQRSGLAAQGYIFSDADAARARELEDRLNRAWAIVNDELRPSWEALASILMDIKSGWTSVVETLGSALHTVNEINAAISTMTGGATNLAQAFAGLIPGLNVIIEARRLYGNLTEPTTEQKARGIGIEFGATDVPLSTFGGLPSRRPNPPTTTARGTKEDTDEAKDAVERFIDTLEKSVAALQAEKDAQGLSNTEKQVAINVAKAAAAAKADDVEFTDQERQRVEALTRSQVSLKEAIDKTKKSTEQAAEAARYFGDQAASAIGDLIVDGKSASEVFNNLSKTILKSLISASLTGGGSLAGILGLAGTKQTGNVGGLAGLGLSLFRPGAATTTLPGTGFYLHEGGTAGYGGISRAVDPAIFAFARRYHSGGIAGLDYDEVPAVLKRGERVVANGSSGSDVSVNVHNYGSPGDVTVSSSRSSSGGINLDVIARSVEQRLANRVNGTNGALTTAIQNVTGGKRQGVR